jgi:hypothetical protein
MSVDFIVMILDMVLFQVVSFCSGAKNLRSGDHCENFSAPRRDPASKEVVKCQNILRW